MAKGEIVTVGVGQCGNQLSRNFWECALIERSQCKQLDIPYYDESSLFHNAFSSGLRARSILVDTEPAVVNETLRSPLGKFYNQQSQTIFEMSGSGNNFACGFFEYGQELSESFLETLQHQVEACDSLQALGIFHSIGGGTGSGLGTKLLSEIADSMPKTMRFTSSIFPSGSTQDVVTSPYNVVLSLAQLTEYAHLVLPIDNGKLGDLARDATKVYKQDPLSGAAESRGKSKIFFPGDQHLQRIQRPSALLGPNKNQREGFKSMNLTAARILIDFTSGTRFGGDSGTRISEVIKPMNCHRRPYVTSSVSSAITTRSMSSIEDSTKSLFCETLNRPNIMVGHLKDFRLRPTLGTTLICRGLGKTDLGTYEKHWKSKMKVNTDNFICGHACGDLVQYKLPAVLCLSNSSVVADTFAATEQAFMSLFKRKAMLHHYTEYCDVEVFEEALQSLKDIKESYMRIK